MRSFIGIALAGLLAVAGPSSAQMTLTGAGGTEKKTSAGTLSCSYTPVTTGTISVAYTGATPSASGGTPAYTFSETGTLPGGLTISSSTGVISGTPTASGSFPGIQVVVTDSLSNTANCGSSFTLVISGGLPGPPVLTAVNVTSGTHSGAVETYTSYSIGTASGFTTRRIIFAVATNDILATAISSVLINGSITPTIHVQQSEGSGFAFSAIFSADIPTGTTATIAVTYNSSIANDQNMTAYSVDDALMVSTTPNTGSATSTSATSLSTSSFNQSTGGFTIAAGGWDTSVTSIGFTGYTTDVFCGSGNICNAHLSSISSSGSAVATATWTGTAGTAIVAASWR